MVRLGTILLVAGVVLTALGLIGEARALGLTGAVASVSWDEPSHLRGLALTLAGVLCALTGWIVRARALTASHETPATFLDAEDEERVLEAIAAFETKTSGELRVHLEEHVTGDVQRAAERAFETLGMTETRERNGVLFFVAARDHRFAVIGDAGIDERVPEGFWKEVVEAVREELAAGRPGEGLARGIRMAGRALVEHFPPREDDVNELPDEISRGG
jgi:uncharacterized membrane protein